MTFPVIDVVHPLTFQEVYHRLHEAVNLWDLLKVASDTGAIQNIEDFCFCHCGHKMRVVSYLSRKQETRYRWVCQKCKTTLFIMHPLPYNKAKIDPKNFLKLYACFCADHPIYYVKTLMKLDLTTIKRWYKIFRHEVVALNEFDAANTVFNNAQVDESCFGSRKYNVGRVPQQQWMFGICDSNKKGKVFMYEVENRSSATLIPIILKHVQANAIVYSDCWRSYDVLKNHAINHLKVNHKVEFVNKENNAHTQRIESMWGACKKWLNSHHYRRHSILNEYIQEYCWRYNHKEPRKTQFEYMWVTLFQ